MANYGGGTSTEASTSASSSRAFFKEQRATFGADLAAADALATKLAALGTDQSSSEYSTPSTQGELWKKFGCDTEAGRALRHLYNKPVNSVNGPFYTWSG